MNTLQILPDHGASAFEPGATVAGMLAWSLVEPVARLEFTAGWHTEGRGTTDGAVITKSDIESPPTHGSQPFSFVLPSTPWSFRGKLIELIWLMEFCIPGSHVMISLPMTVSPGGKEIILDKVEPQKLPGGFPIFASN